MYDDEEEIKEKRKKMIIIGISIVVGLIIILIIWAILKPSKKKNVEVLKELDCQIGVIGNIVPINGVYTQPLEIEFTSITPVSSEYPITKKTIGTTDNARNTETYKVIKSGNYKLHGYVQDAAGNKKVCDLDITVAIGQPTCELEVKSGTLGEDDWYNSDIEVGFKTMSTNSEMSSIKQYYIDTLISDMENDEDIKVELPNENKETYIVKEDQETIVVGYVVDSNGSQGRCTLKVKKDSTPPSCTLKVSKGTLNQSGQYTDEPVIEFNSATDDITEVVSEGVGITENYIDSSYKVTQEGMTIVYGYVKDTAGNPGICSIAVNRPTTQPTQQGQTGQQPQTQQPTQPEQPTQAEQPQQTPQETTNYLSTKAKKGDYVTYTAGTWNETVIERTSSSSDYSWGYTSGKSKDAGVKCRGKDDTGTPKTGWRVLGVTNVNGETNVVLIHASTPECFYHAASSASQATTFMNQRAQGYLDGNFAQAAKALDCTTIAGTCTENLSFSSSDDLYNIGIHYYLATPKSTTSTLWEVTSNGRITGYSRMSNGLRPVIVLKANIKVTGGDGSQGNPWVLSW